jgi:putative endonuclease
MSYYVYVLRSAEGKRYTGHTPDLERRLLEHNSGTTFTTKKGHDWRIIYKEEFASRAEAMKREKYLKTGKGREELDRLIGVESAAAE